jgi:hypothetical protein
MNKLLLAGVGVLAIAGGVSATTQQPMLQVVAGARTLTTAEKVAVDGRCGCTPDEPPAPSKPGYGFGDKNHNHYGPPGQGFTPQNNWRSHAAGDGLTPTGRPLPPRAFR